jgi:hypothetical protein
MHTLRRGDWDFLLPRLHLQKALTLEMENQCFLSPLDSPYVHSQSFSPELAALSR